MYRSPVGDVAAVRGLHRACRWRGRCRARPERSGKSSAPCARRRLPATRGGELVVLGEHLERVRLRREAARLRRHHIGSFGSTTTARTQELTVKEIVCSRRGCSATAQVRSASMSAPCLERAGLRGRAGAHPGELRRRAAARRPLRAALAKRPKLPRGRASRRARRNRSRRCRSPAARTDRRTEHCRIDRHARPRVAERAPDDPDPRRRLAGEGGQPGSRRRRAGAGCACPALRQQARWRSRSRSGVPRPDRADRRHDHRRAGATRRSARRSGNSARGVSAERCCARGRRQTLRRPGPEARARPQLERGCRSASRCRRPVRQWQDDASESDRRTRPARHR